MKKSVLLLNDTTNWYHFGCTATSIALKEEITKLGYSLTSFSITETYKILSVPNTYEKFLSQESFEKFADDNSRLIELLRTHDAVVVNGEGTLHGLNQAPLSLLYAAYVAKSFLGKHVEIINHSVYPEEGMEMYKLVYQAMDFVAIREPRSLDAMRQIGIEVTASFDCLPLYIKNHYKRKHIKHDKVLLVAGSAAWLELNIPSPNAGDINKFAEGIDGFVNYLEMMSSNGYEIQFLYGAAAYPSKDDREFIQFVEPRLKDKWTVVTVSSVDEWLERIETAGLLVSGRFHHTIAAACLGTAFIAMESNTPKMIGLMNMLGGDVISFRDSDILHKLMAGTQRRTNLLNELCSMAEHNFKALSTLAA